MSVKPDQNMDGAKIDVDAWRRRIRDDTFAHYHREMGVAMLREEPAAAAAAAFERALAILPDDPVSGYGLVLALRAAGRQAEAAGADERLRARNPEYWSHGVFAMAHGAREADRWREAQALYREVADAKPDHEEARDCLGLCLAQANDWKGAQAIYDAVAPRPDWRDAQRIADGHVSLGTLLLSQGDQMHAEMEIRRGLAIDSDNYIGLKNLGAFLARQNCPDAQEEAAVMLERAHQLLPESLEISHWLCHLLLAMGQISRGESLLRQMIECGSATAYDRFLLSMALVAARRYAEAEEVAQATLDISPREHFGYVALGEVFLAVGNPEAAMTTLRSAVDVLGAAVRNFPTIPALRAFAAWTLGRFDEAEADAEWALRLARTDRALAVLGLVRHRQGRTDDALKLLTRAGEAAPLKAWPFICQAAVLYDLGREAEGDAALMRAHQAQPAMVGSQIEQHSWMRAALEAGAGRLGLNLSAPSSC